MAGSVRYPQYGSRRWKRLRAQLLAEGPLCHWGCGRPATTADHVPSLLEVGVWHWNVVPACSKCNFGRGGGVPVPVVVSRSRVW